MAAMSRGLPSKLPARLRAPKKVKGGTESTRNHSFKGFSQRIAQLKIEPVRRGRSTILDDAELDVAFSYFRDAFLEWRELNLSEAFTSFARRIAPLCDSLPQVIHHSDRIMELLVEYIQNGEKFAQEPLLSLMAHLAHDLGEHFEKHFEQAVRTVSHLAATHPDVEVIEWSFGCLAWLFKYLSRLLVPDLRPVFDLMSPLLGKERQKVFVSRFAAESLSFLIRKAGAGYHRDTAPLRLIVKHISKQLQDAQSTPKDSDFQYGIMYLLADSLKGVQKGLHSSAVAILKEILIEAYATEHEASLEPVLLGVITAIIHHTDASSFQPLLETVIAQLNLTAADANRVSLSSRLLFVMCGVRHGTRIEQWDSVLTCLKKLLALVPSVDQIDDNVSWDLLSAILVTFQYCSFDVIIPHEHILEDLTRSHWESFFLPFCNLFADVGKERFRTLLLPHFKKFVFQKAHEHDLELSIVTRRLFHYGLIVKDTIQPSSTWKRQQVQLFHQLSSAKAISIDTEHLTYCCNAVLPVMDVLVVDPATKGVVPDLLCEVLLRSLLESTDQASATVRLFATGAAFEFYMEHCQSDSPLIDAWASVCTASEVYGNSVSFWRALLAFVRRYKPKISWNGPHIDILRRSLLRCLGSPSHDLRITAINILELIISDDEDKQKIISTALLIEQTPLTLEHQRSLSMRLGQLAKQYPLVLSDELLKQAIPTYCFGLLHVRLTSVWDDACLALKTMCDSKEGEQNVTRIAFEWLSAPIDQMTEGTSNVAPAPRRYVSEFECTNILHLHEAVVEVQEQLRDTGRQVKTLFEQQHVRTPFTNAFCRTQALRLLNTVPHVAEKRARHLIPILLDWALDQPTSVLQSTESEKNENHLTPQCRWSRKDQKAMLSIFAKFTNPKVLHRSHEVHTALLALLGNGDLDIQKTALQALLAWKEPRIVRYKEELLGLLDDARFRDELPLFLSEGEIQDEDANRILPLVLRLLYGKVIAGKRGLESKRKAVFIGLKNRFGDEAIHQFLRIAFGPLNDISLWNEESLDHGLLQKEIIDTRKQVGLLNMVDDLLSTFGSTFAPFTAQVVEPILFCLITASRAVFSHTDQAAGGSNDTIKLSLLRTVRQRAVHILAKLVENCPDFAWRPYTTVIVSEVIEPRLDLFPIETAQSISGHLRLYSAWASSLTTTPFLVEYNKSILNKILDCLQVASAKDEVLKFILDDILGRIILLRKPHEESEALNMTLLRDRVRTEVLEPYSNAILSSIGALLHRSPSKDVLESGVKVVADLAPHVIGSAETRSMIELATFLLKQPSLRVNPRTKSGLLRILHEFIFRSDQQDIDELFAGIFDAICPMFAFVQDHAARHLLCEIIEDLSREQKDLEHVAKLCHDLNSCSKSRLDEPDFERRLHAFKEINTTGYQLYSLRQWKPLAFNMLYLMRDDDELSIRTNASLALRRLIQVSEEDDFQKFFISAIMPGIQGGMKENSEFVRTEFLAVLEEVAKTHSWASVTDLRVLVSDDDESSFFTNILHIQGHRRIRALRRLAACAPLLKTADTYHLLLPLLEHFVFNKADGTAADTLSGETIKTITILSEWLEWPQMRSLLRRYIGYLFSKEDLQKSVIKLIVGVMDSLNRASSVKGYIDASGVDAAVRLKDQDSHSSSFMDVDHSISMLSRTLPQREKLANDLTAQFLPSLIEYLHKKDESTVSLRVPIAVAICKVLLILPPSEIEARLPGVLLDICYILKSRAQESRDMSRNTLTEIATSMGHNYIGFVLKAMRTALQRGYQLHVLSFSLHHILVNLTEQLQPGDLDYCLQDIVEVIMDDIFGVTGQEKDAEEYISKMKEVKSSKSFDSMDIVSRSATPGSLFKLIIPIKTLLLERLNARTVRKVDELLRRIGLGILQNPTVGNREILIFCFELIQDVYQVSATTDGQRQANAKMKRYLVNMKGAAKSGARLSTSSYTYKLLRFSLEILRTVLRKHEGLQTPQNLAGFLPVIGDAMVEGQEEVQVAAIRLLTTIIKIPMSELDKNCPVYVDEAVRAIKGAPSSNTELAQASLKLISAVLRDKPGVNVKDRDIGHLIKRIVPDLDEPDRQGVSFGFIKTVVNRRLDIPEIYEAMDKVAEMMITNHTKSTRDAARNHYFQFLSSYVQSEKRFKKQVEFLLRNLRYEHAEGRQSAMEALDLVITKALPRFSDKTQYEYQGLLFLPLINTLANDDSGKCREMASLLIKRLFQHTSNERTASFTTDLRHWLGQNDNAGLRRLGLQCWGFFFEAVESEHEVAKYLPDVLDQVDNIIDGCLAHREESDWELLYHSLTLLAKICKRDSNMILTSSKESLWTAIQASTSYPHAWVKIKSAELMGTYFAHLAASNKDNGYKSLPLEGAGGLQLAEQSMIQLTDTFLKNMLHQESTEQLCVQSIKNIAFIARCFADNGATWQWQGDEDGGEGEGEVAPSSTALREMDDSGDSATNEFATMKKTNGTAPQTAIHRLMIRLSGLVRRDNRSIFVKTTTMHLLETIYTKFPLQPLTSSLQHVLTTLNTLTDPATTIPHAHTDANTVNEPNEQYKSLIEKAREVMNTLQKRMGTQEYLSAMGEVQKAIRARREERRQKRKVEAVANPERAEKEKKRRHDVKRVKRKEKSMEFRGKRRGW